MFNKQNLIEKVRQTGSVSGVQAERIVDVMLDSLKSAVKKGDKVSIAGLGIFIKKQVKGRVGRNPRTGESVKIAPHSKVKFTPAKSFKEFVNA